MKRRTLIGLSALALVLIALAQHIAPPTHAGGPGSIVNLSDSVSNDVVTYELCVLAATPPPTGGVIVTDSGGRQRQAMLVATDQTCGSGTYVLQTSFTGLAAGNYQFQTACLVTQGAEATTACVDRATGLTSNFQGASVANQCQVDFNPTTASALRNCTGPGVVGDLTGVVVQPTNTPSATVTTTPTATPCGTAPPLTIRVPRVLLSGHRLTVSGATLPDVPVMIVAYTLMRPPVVLARQTVRSGTNGYFVGSALVTYHPAKPVLALTTVQTGSGCSRASASKLVLVLP